MKGFRMKRVNEIWDLLINRILFTGVEWFCRMALALQVAICVIIFIGRGFFFFFPLSLYSAVGRIGRNDVPCMAVYPEFIFGDQRQYPSQNDCAG